MGDGRTETQDVSGQVVLSLPTVLHHNDPRSVQDDTPLWILTTTHRCVGTYGHMDTCDTYEDVWTHVDVRTHTGTYVWGTLARTDTCEP